MIIVLVVTLLTAAGCKQRENAAPGVSLHIAALQGNIAAIKQHIQAGSDLNAKDQYGSTPLIIAAVFGKTNVALALIEAGADLNMTNNDGSTALISAAVLCRTEIVLALLEKGADKTLKNKSGKTAWDAVAGPFEDVKPIYDQLGAALGPIGLKLDYERIKATRPRIAEMLRD